jgi:hypothetical protein
VSEVVLQLTQHGKATKIAWIGPFNRQYLADTDSLRDASVSVRRILGQVADEYVHGTRSYAAYLRGLARAGAALRSAIVTAADGTFHRSVLDGLDRLPRETPLRIVTDGLEVPWNFVYAGAAPNEVATQNTLEDFKDFWLSRFKVRIRFSNTNEMPDPCISRSKVRTLLALHESRFRSAVTLLTNELPDLKDKVNCLLEHQIGSTNNWIDCEEKWREIEENDSIFYIFAHRDEEGRLSLKDNAPAAESDRYEISSNEFQAFFRKGNAVAAQSNTLCFVNGCRTAAQGWGERLLSATSAAGFQGFIGSEAEVASDLATRYAVEFLFALLKEGKSVDEAYEETKTKCFPMSLWYSCYAHPSFRISQE